MKQATKLVFFFSAFSFLLTGCSGGSGGALDQDYLERSKVEGPQKRAIFERAGGEYDKMNSEDKQKYLSFFKQEQDAKNFWELMKNPPRSVGVPSGGATATPVPSSAGQ